MSETHYIIATHGKLSQGYIDTIELLTHKENVHALTAYGEEEFPENLISLMNTFEKGDGVIIFTDLICGSVTQKIMELYGSDQRMHLFAGINLSLILEVLLYEQFPDEAYCYNVVSSAKDQICYLHGTCSTRE